MRFLIGSTKHELSLDFSSVICAAVNYALTNGYVNPTKKYNCGDSELELMLK
jgi:hypothetical protein